VPEGTRKSFERLRTLYAYGVLCYDLYTVAGDLARLVIEQALRERFLPFYDETVTFVHDRDDLKRVQTEAASGLAASSEDSLRRHRPEPPRRRPAQPWQVTGVPGPRHQRRITTRVPVYQRVSRCVTASEWVTPVLLPVPAVKV
jgi:hypothetical protein